MKSPNSSIILSLSEQIAAALEMLKIDLQKCPDEVWDSTNYGPPFWQVAYHVMVYFDWYLSKTTEEREHFTPYFKDVPWDLKPNDISLSKSEILKYYEIIQDITPPELISIEFNATTAIANDIVKLSLNVTDDLSGVQDSIQCVLYSPSNNVSIIIYPYFNGLSGFYEGEFTINEFWPSGNYYIGAVYLFDNEGKYIWLFNSTDFNAPVVFVFRTIEDTTPPELISLNIDLTFVHANDKLTVMIKAIDDISGIKSVQCALYGPNYTKYLDLDFMYNRTNGYYESEFTIIDTWPIGYYSIEKITLIDNKGNQVILENGIDYTSPVLEVAEDEIKASFNLPGYPILLLIILMGFNFSYLINKNYKNYK